MLMKASSVECILSWHTFKLKLLNFYCCSGGPLISRQPIVLSHRCSVGSDSRELTLLLLGFSLS